MGNISKWAKAIAITTLTTLVGLWILARFFPSAIDIALTGRNPVGGNGGQ
jgi:hypothetical protein